jgi:hypothetical protein
LGGDSNVIKNDLLNIDVLPLIFNSVSEEKMSIKHSSIIRHRNSFNYESGIPLLLFSTLLERLAGSPVIAA